MPPPERPSRGPRFRRVHAHLINLLWATVAAGVPWAWFLVRDLGTAMQVVALALPVLVVAALIGLAISALDERRLSSLLVAASVVAFGWVTILGPRSALPASPPVDPIRIVSITLDGSNLNASAILGTLAKQRPDLAVIVELSKKARGALLRTDRYRFSLESGRIVVLSSVPIRELPLPKPLASDLVVRLQVDRPEGAFIVYAVRTNDSPLDAAMNNPIEVERLQDSG
jgi:endonuclease/exonuclease/phosphatase (EEP) superfamily protein YafD